MRPDGVRSRGAQLRETKNATFQFEHVAGHRATLSYPGDCPGSRPRHVTGNNANLPRCNVPDFGNRPFFLRASLGVSVYNTIVLGRPCSDGAQPYIRHPIKIVLPNPYWLGRDPAPRLPTLPQSGSNTPPVTRSRTIMVSYLLVGLAIGGASLPYRATAQSIPDDDDAATACQKRLSANRAVFKPLGVFQSPAGCGGPDFIYLERIVLPNHSEIAIEPPATLRCEMAEAMVSFVRQDLAPAAAAMGAPLSAIENFDSYDCRGRNRQVGAQMSEHGRANALDIRSIRLKDGRVVRPTDTDAPEDVPRRHEDRGLQSLHDRAGSGIRRLSRGPHPHGPRRASQRLPPLPLGICATAQRGRRPVASRSSATRRPACGTVPRFRVPLPRVPAVRLRRAGHHPARSPP